MFLLSVTIYNCSRNDLAWFTLLGPMGVHGLVDLGLDIGIHGVALMAAGNPHTAQSPRVSQGPFDWMYKLLMVPALAQFH